MTTETNFGGGNFDISRALKKEKISRQLWGVQKKFDGNAREILFFEIRRFEISGFDSKKIIVKNVLQSSTLNLKHKLSKYHSTSFTITILKKKKNYLFNMILN